MFSVIFNDLYDPILVFYENGVLRKFIESNGWMFEILPDGRRMAVEHRNEEAIKLDAEATEKLVKKLKFKDIEVAYMHLILPEVSETFNIKPSKYDEVYRTIMVPIKKEIAKREAKKPKFEQSPWNKRKSILD